LQEGQRVGAADPPERIMERVHQLGRDLQKQHGGCARCTVAALQEAMGFAPVDAGLRRAASCLDGGATPNGVQNCGAFTGAGMFIGWTCGTAEFQKPPLPRKLIRQVYQQFENQYGSVLCKDVKAKAGGNCPDVVGRAARWTAEALLQQFAGYRESANT
jgi:C_GCAxxG_C_C family probable redox protein